ncbi:amino acid permease [Clostridium sp. AWRP]|uniref:APC family permease n=1 Tax=Clostridium sp. AWRP TaxID=2212991 RepID=UPI000FD93BB8|nr:amino acid permease [Clostridium sp. AWRP]AZV57050.1 amino acid permease [Clostridium sp. AWRP]
MPQQTQLKRNIRLFEGIIFVIGFVIGSGIFMKPSVVLKNTGSPGGALTIWIVGGLITICSALSISEIAAYIPKLGGLYTYLSEIYGEVFGFLYGWVEAIISSPGGSAAMAIAVATFATYFIPMNGIQQKALAVGLIVFIVIVNAIATKWGVWLQTIATVVKLVPIAAIIIFGLANGTAHDISFANVGVTQSAGIGVALLGVLWAYDGWINTCTLGSEMENSEKNLPISIITGVLFVIVVYALFNTAIFNVLPAAQIMSSDKVGVDVSVKLFGSGATAFITAGMMVSVFGALNAQMVCGTRIALAMGQKRELPMGEVLGAIHPKLRTPINALIFQGIITIIFVLSGSFNSLTDLTIFVIWIFFTLGVFGLFVLRKRITRNPKLYHVPLYPVIPAIGIIGGCYLMFATIMDSFLSAMFGIGLTLIGLPIYYYCKKKKTDRNTKNI